MGDFIGVWLGLCFVVLFAVAWTKIFVKAGYSAWMGLLMLVPLVNVVVFLCLAFTEWPVHARMRPAMQQEPPANI